VTALLPALQRILDAMQGKCGQWDADRQQRHRNNIHRPSPERRLRRADGTPRDRHGFIGRILITARARLGSTVRRFDHREARFAGLFSALSLHKVNFGGAVGGCRHDAAIGEVFVGSRAVAEGALSRHELRKWYRPIFRDVYVPKASTVTLRDRTVGAWLSTHGQAVIAGSGCLCTAWCELGGP